MGFYFGFRKKQTLTRLENARRQQANFRSERFARRFVGIMCRLVVSPLVPMQIVLMRMRKRDCEDHTRPWYGVKLFSLEYERSQVATSADVGLTKIHKRIDADTGHLLETNNCLVQCSQLKFPTRCLLDHSEALEVRMSG